MDLEMKIAQLLKAYVSLLNYSKSNLKFYDINYFQHSKKVQVKETEEKCTEMAEENIEVPRGENVVSFFRR